jgi:hypothetical protein
MTSSGIVPATFWLVARYCVPPVVITIIIVFVPKYVLYLEEQCEDDDTEENWTPLGDPIEHWGHDF